MSLSQTAPPPLPNAKLVTDLPVAMAQRARRRRRSARQQGQRPRRPRSSRDVVAALAVDAISAIGTGMAMPYLVVYLHTDRHISLSTATLAVTVVAAAGLLGNPLGGWAGDRSTARKALAIGLS